MRSLYSKKKNKEEQKDKFQSIVELVKDIDEDELEDFIEGISLCWKCYHKINKAKTISEKEYGDIDSAEEFLEAESGRD